MTKSAVFVNSGTFLVDRRRALEKLKQFQLPDPYLFILPLIRAAVASAATYVDIDSSKHQAGVEFRFDGRPFSPKELGDPYGGLFENLKEEGTRRRYLAIGLLSALRLNPAHITIISGHRRVSRCRLKITSLDEDIQLNKSDPPGRDITILTVQGYNSKTASTVYGVLHDQKIIEWCAMSPITIRIFRKALHSFKATPSYSHVHLDIRDGQVRGSMTVPEIGKGTIIRAYTWGVLAQTIDSSATGDQNSLPIHFDALINDDGFTLNASQTAVVRNRRYRNALEILNRAIGPLILEVIKTQGRMVSRVRDDLMDPDILREWQLVWDEIERARARTFGAIVAGGLKRLRIPWDCSSAPPAKKVQSLQKKVQMRQFIRNHLWLRTACEKMLSDYDMDQSDEVKRALWKAPLLFDVLTGLVSLEEIELERRRLGYVPYSKDRLLSSDAVSRRMSHIVWMSGRADLAFLQKLFPKTPTAVVDRFGVTKVPVQSTVQDTKVPIALPVPAPSAPPDPELAVAPIESRPIPQKKAPNESGVDTDSIVSLLRDLFDRLKDRHGLKLTNPGDRTIHLISDSHAGDILPGFNEKSWRLNRNHLLVHTVISSPLSAMSKRDYLASILYTAVNRKLSEIQDQDDVAFQEALVEALAEA